LVTHTPRKMGEKLGDWCYKSVVNNLVNVMDGIYKTCHKKNGWNL